MTKQQKTDPLFSVVVPAYNESEGIKHFHSSLVKELRKIPAEVEILYVDDGSKDDTLQCLLELEDEDSSVRVLALARNFGKEVALSAGIEHTRGDAVLTLDADGQHPVAMIPELYAEWSKGEYDIMVGVRTDTASDTFVKRQGSKLFYKLLRVLAPDNKTKSNATDFRIISHEVRDAFASMGERDRMARGLIDWLGYEVSYFDFVAPDREFGQASYSTKKLIRLAFDSFIAASFKPLYLSLYLGALALVVSFVTAVFIAANALLGDPLNLRATGSAYFVLLIVFLVAIVLIGQGMIAYYLSKIFVEARARPLYVVHKRRSKNL